MSKDTEQTVLEWMMYNYNKSVAILLLGALLIADFWNGVLPILMGYVIFIPLYQARKLLYSQGIARLYGLGLFALLPLIAMIFFNTSNDDTSWGLIRLFDRTGLAPAPIISSIPVVILNFRYLFFSPLIAVTLYLLWFEFSRPELKKKDLEILGLKEAVLFTRPGISAMIYYAVLLLLAYLIDLRLTILVLGFILLNEIKTLEKLRFILSLVLLAICGAGIFYLLYHRITALFAGREFGSIFYSFGYELDHLHLVNVARHNVTMVLFLPAVLIELIKSYGYTKEIAASIKPVYIDTANSVYIGQKAPSNAPNYISDEENNRHQLVLGKSGSGKTVYLMNHVKSCTERSLPCIFIDAKGTFDLVVKMAMLAERSGRVFKLFTLNSDILDKPDHAHLAYIKKYISTYSPFSEVTGATGWKNRVMALFEAVTTKSMGELYYKNQWEIYITSVLNVCKKANMRLDLVKLVQVIKEQDILTKAALDLGLVDDAHIIESADTEGLSTVYNQLRLFTMTDYGYLFDTSKTDMPTIDLAKSIANNEIILFLLNGSAFKVDTERVAQMVISDLNATFSSFPVHTKCYCIFDEFSGYISPALATTLDKGRSYGMHAIVGTQSLSVIENRQGGKELVEALTANISTFTILPLSNASDIEAMANVLGTKKTTETTTQINYHEGGGTGLGSSKIVDKYIINPQDIRHLQRGEAYIYRTDPYQLPYKLKVNYINFGSSK